MKKTSLLCAATAATLLAAPAGALAKGTVIAGPVKVKGYDLTITASDGSSDSLAVTAVKTKGASSQLHSWSFPNAKVTVKGATATIKGDLGRYGKIAGKVRRGTLTGTTKLVLDSTFFKTVKSRSMKARILKAVKPHGGTTTPGTSHGLMLSSSADTADGTLMVTVSKTGSKVTQTVMRSDAAAKTAPASVLHLITARTGEDGLHAAPDLQNASAPAAGPFLLGQLAFAGEPMGTMATGQVSGDFAAQFDSIGQQWLPDENDAILMQH